MATRLRGYVPSSRHAFRPARTGLARVFRRSTLNTPTVKSLRYKSLKVLSDLRDQVQAPAVPRPTKADIVPERPVLALWREAQAVCFDVDCTVTQQDSLDLLAEFLGRGEQVATITNKVRVSLKLP
jgi:hypothetical protein